MPRQLPWKIGGGGSRTQTISPSTRPQRTARVPDDIEDDVLNHTALSGSSKGKGKAGAISDSDDSLSGPPTPRTARVADISTEQRAASSSPPPLADDALPNEPMRKGVSKFDLRDDEWMMVEDEFLETAKLFTRHLHIAEYERLKETIEAKKKEAEIVRPVVAGAKRSVLGAMKEKARAQVSRQEEAIQDVFASLGSESEEDAAHRVKSSKKTSTLKPPLAASESQETSSDDLDTPRPPKPQSTSLAPSSVSQPRPTPPPAWKPGNSTFAKPALPAPAAETKSRTRASRMTPLDMLDEYTPKRPSSITSTGEAYRSQSISSTSSPQRSQLANSDVSRRSVNLSDDWGYANDDRSKSQTAAERIAKRKAGRTKEGEAEQTKKKRATRLEDIPTFLV